MKISCLTVTQMSRMHLLGRAISSFSQQSLDEKYREIIVVHNEGPETSAAIKNLLDENKIDGNIILTARAPLGTLRNVSMQYSTGNLCCLWDDDDYAHPDRLKWQSFPFSSSHIVATTLSSQFYWFVTEGKLFIRTGGVEGIHGTVMFRKLSGLVFNPTLSKGEDSELITEIQNKFPDGICAIEDHPELFVRRFHGHNTWDFDHHYERLFKQAKQADWLRVHEQKIRTWAAELHIAALAVCDNNGQPVFWL